MTAPLLVLVAHGLDLLVTLQLLTLVGGWGETNPIARAAHDAAGAGGIVGLKAGGTLAMLRLLRPDVPRSEIRLALAGGSGVVLAAVGLLSWSLVA